MGLIKDALGWLTGKNPEDPARGPDGQLINELTQPPKKMETLIGDILPPGATVGKQVIVNGKVITDPAEIARTEQELATMLDGPLGAMDMFRHGMPQNTSISHEVKAITKRAWINGKEVTDPGEIERLLAGARDKKED